MVKMISRLGKSKKNNRRVIDLHSHILPGIDDGSVDFDTSVELIKELIGGGVSDVFATPHYVDETIYISPRSTNKELLNKLTSRLEKEGVKVNIYLGNEVYITPRILELLKNKEITVLGKSRYLLVELPMSGDFPGYQDIFLKLIRVGFCVVLAHPERYTSFQNDYSLVTELHEMGVLFQCNFGSFVGKYGKTVLKLVTRLAKDKMIWGMGSDIHRVRGESLIPEAIKKMSKYYSDAELEEILVKNPQKILEPING